MRTAHLLTAILMTLALGCSKSDLPQPGSTSDLAIDVRNTTVQDAQVLAFMPAGELGGPNNLLTPGDIFPPTSKAKATLKRTSSYIQINLHTTGLPPGAYTMWIILFNDVEQCTAPNPLGGACGEADLLNGTTAIIWGDGKVVHDNGVGNFQTRLAVGERREPGTQEAFIGEALPYALVNPEGAEVHLIVKYHGPVSSDPDVLNEQLTTLLGSCGVNDGANSFDAGPIFGVQCFDPQFSVFPTP